MNTRIFFAAYQSNRSSNGGMESATQIFEALASDFSWTLLTNRYTQRTARWEAAGAQVIHFEFDENANRSTRAVRLSTAAGKALALTARKRPDVLHGNDIRAVQVLLPAAWLTRSPFALTLRDTKPAGEVYGRHWQRVARRLNVMVTLSDEMQHAAAGQIPMPRSRMRTISSIVDLSRFRPVSSEVRTLTRAQLGIENREFALGIVAALSAKKRQLEVIEHVMPRLADTDVRLHIIGDFAPETDAYARAAVKAVEDRGMQDRVLFHGFQENVADWLRTLDLLILPSAYEGLARCMIEAMACGTPVVSVEVASAREMLDETGAGVVVGANDWAGMVVAVRRLIDDPERRRRMGEAGRTVAEQRFHAERVAAQWRDLYLQLARRGAGT